MQTMAGSYPQSDIRSNNCLSVVGELANLLEDIQANIKMLEMAIAGETSSVDQDAYENVVILDDVTPCYLKANAALHACKAGLGLAVRSLLNSEASGR